MAAFYINILELIYGSNNKIILSQGTTASLNTRRRCPAIYNDSKVYAYILYTYCIGF